MTADDMVALVEDILTDPEYGGASWHRIAEVIVSSLPIIPADHCRYCDKDYPRLPVKSHHHYEEPTLPAPDRSLIDTLTEGAPE
jgi:hypothetical protein